MKPIMQRIGENANCMTACIASFLDLELDDNDIVDVYAFKGEVVDGWFKAFSDYFKRKGYRVIFDTFTYDEFVDEWKHTPSVQENIEEIHFACGKTHRNPLVGHCVLYKKGKLLHDPYPDGKGLDSEEEYFIYLIKENNNEIKEK